MTANWIYTIGYFAVIYVAYLVAQWLFGGFGGGSLLRSLRIWAVCALLGSFLIFVMGLPYGLAIYGTAGLSLALYVLLTVAQRSPRDA